MATQTCLLQRLKSVGTPNIQQLFEHTVSTDVLSCWLMRDFINYNEILIILAFW